MKKKKFLLWMLILMLLSGAVYYYFVHSAQEDGDAFLLIPEDAVYILESDRPIESWYRLSNSLLWTRLKNHPYFSEITEDANYLDTLIHENQRIFGMLGKRKTLISAHLTEQKDYDFLFTIRLEKALRSTFSTILTDKLFGLQGFKVSSFDYKGQKVTQLYNPADKSNLFLMVAGSFLQCSYNKDIIIRSIDHFVTTEHIWAEMTAETSLEGIGRLFVNYAYLDDFMACYMSPVDPQIKDLSQLLGNSAYSIDTKKDQWFLEGSSLLNDSVYSYMSAFLRSGKGEGHAASIVSNRAALMVDFSFSNMNTFYQELKNSLQMYPDRKKQFEQAAKQTERFLNLNLEEDILGWIGNEIAFAQMKPSKFSTTSEDIAVFVRARSEAAAEKYLEILKKKVRRRTPAKIQNFRFRNYEIRFFGIKGFFKLLFGRMFSKMESPYYVQIDDWVVFSQSPRTLIGVIEDYEANRVLMEEQQYLDVVEQFPKEGSIKTYVNLSNSFGLIKNRLNAESRRDFSKSIVHMQHMKGFGLYLSADGKRMNTKMILQIMDQSELKEQLEDAEIEELYREKLEGTAIDSLSETERFVAEKLNEREWVVYYPGKEQVFYRCELKNKKLHGMYEEYFPSGQLRVEGRYRRGKKEGAWKYFDAEGNLIKKQKY